MQSWPCTSSQRVVPAISGGLTLRCLRSTAKLMSDHLNEIPPAARLLSGDRLGRLKIRRGQLRFTGRDESPTAMHVQGGMLAAMLDSATGNAIMANLSSI